MEAVNKKINKQKKNEKSPPIFEQVVNKTDVALGLYNKLNGIFFIG